MKALNKLVSFFVGFFEKKKRVALNLTEVQDAPKSLRNYRKDVGISIGRSQYWYGFPYAKITSGHNNEGSFFKYIEKSGSFLFPTNKELYPQIADWLRGEVEDDTMEETKLMYLSDLRVCGDPMGIIVKNNACSLQLILVMQYGEKRSLSEVVTLLKALDEQERKFFGGFQLLNPFGMLESKEAKVVEFQAGLASAYCIYTKAVK